MVRWTDSSSGDDEEESDAAESSDEEEPMPIPRDEPMTLEFYLPFQKRHVKFAVLPTELPDVIKLKVALAYDLNEVTMTWMNEAYENIDFNKAWKQQKVPELSIDVRGFKGNALQCYVQQALVASDTMEIWDTSPEAADMVLERMSKPDRAALEKACAGKDFKLENTDSDPSLTYWIAKAAVLEALMTRDAIFDDLMDKMKEHSHFKKVGK